MRPCERAGAGSEAARPGGQVDRGCGRCPREIVDKQTAGSGLAAKLTGAPVKQLEIRNAVERDRRIYNGLGFVVGIAAEAFLTRFGCGS